ncbi:MAG: SIMPL domain-containing protein [Alphaproteobacteria bacterium]|nr:SIMPL domain-containing protein [Alphaproteobacteria bacterium]
MKILDLFLTSYFVVTTMVAGYFAYVFIDQRRPSITTNGLAEQIVTANLLNFGIDVVTKTSGGYLDEHHSKIKKIIKHLNDNGIKNDSINIREKINCNNYVLTTLDINTSDVDFIDKKLKDSDTKISYKNYNYTKAMQLRNNLEKKATDTAYKNLKALAKQLGVDLSSKYKSIRSSELKRSETREAHLDNKRIRYSVEVNLSQYIK